MNFISRTITGGILIIIGLILTILSVYTQGVTLFHGIPILIIGFFIFFNKKEDEIEQIRGEKKSERRKKRK
jgi:membrane-bound ClpP family serine protease